MEIKDDEINLFEIWQVVWKRRYMIITITMISAVLALLVSLQLSKIYEGEAIVALPRGGADNKAIVSLDETRAITGTLLKEIKRGNPFDSFDSNLIRLIADIKFDQIKESDSKVKVVVQVKDEPRRAEEVLIKMVEYLRENAYVTKRLDIEKAAIEANLTEIRKAVERATRTRDEAIRLISTRNPVGFNPVELDVKVNDLGTKMIGLETSLSMLKGYEFVMTPHAYDKPIKPRVAVNTLIAGIVGLFAGVLLSFIMDTVNNKRTL